MRILIRSIRLSLLTLTLFSCEKNDDPPLKEDFRHEEFLSNTPGETVTITVNGNDLACKLVGDLYIFQDDIVFTRQQLKKSGSLKGAGLTTMRNYWEFATVYFTIEEGFHEEERIYAAIEHWEENTELKFIKRTEQNNYVKFIESQDGTASQLGMVGGQQLIWIEDWATAGTVIHEIGHAVGLYHEHSKPNRDDYVVIHSKNIESSEAINFELVDIAIITGGFDFASIMLYSSYAGSKNGEPTITRLDGSVYNSQRDYLSSADIETIKMMYDDFDCLDCVRGQVTDIDLNTYQTVKIGNQWWMAENLATTRFNDGTEIPNITDNWEWYDASTEAYCWYENDEVTYKETFGALYNYYTVETEKLCPDGWHIPFDYEWSELEMYLGMSESEALESGRRGTTEGGKLKAAGYDHWYEPNTGATNESGFTGLPGGYRYFSDGDFYDLGSTGNWWGLQIDEEGMFRPKFRELGSTHSQVYRAGPWEESGYSVRCIKD